MGIAETLVLAVGLGLDAFSVALAVGGALGRATKRQTFRLSFHFGLFQFLMPLAGWALGRGAVGFVRDYDHWVAFGLLFSIGAHMIYGSFQKDGARAAAAVRDPTRGWSLVGLSLATSLDALGAGVGLGILGRRLFWAAAVIGLVAGAMTLAGIRAGGRLHFWAGRWMETLGGGVLVGLSIKMLWI